MSNALLRLCAAACAAGGLLLLSACDDGADFDTAQQIEGHLITRHYDGFAGPQGPRIRGRARTGGPETAPAAPVAG